MLASVFRHPSVFSLSYKLKRNLKPAVLFSFATLHGSGHFAMARLYVITLFLAVLGVASAATTSPSSTSPIADSKSNQIILRNLAQPRFFGAAANTTFLFHDVNYTKVISTQVRKSLPLVTLSY